MRQPYQMDLFDLDDRPYQPICDSNPFMVSRMYYCPKCRELVGMFMKEGRDKGWHDVKAECKNGHRLNWEAIIK